MSIFSENSIMFILYVRNQGISRDLYSKVFDMEPTLDVPGMTEFQLMPGVSLGLMPGDGITSILENKVVNPDTNREAIRCELYVFVSDPDACLKKLVQAGGSSISNGALRNWGDYVAYGCDYDGNIVAFAKKINRE
ncbi:MAG: VOC family protein [Bacillota bacterium]